MIANVSFAQRNVIKGRVFVFPFPWFTYSLGLGYERVLANDISLQLLYNNYGYNNTKGDGNAIYTQGIVPEIRYYFGKNNTFRKNFFFGVFTEILYANEQAGGYTGDIALGSYMGSVRKMINPGILFGKNIALGKQWHLGGYIGWKYKLMSITEKYINNGAVTYIDSNEQMSGLRAGVNAAYVF